MAYAMTRSLIFSSTQLKLSSLMENESKSGAGLAVPHQIALVSGSNRLDEERLAEVGPRIEHDEAFPERINVNVASIADGVVTLRTWERGAGLTLACGTGACATAVAAIVQKRALSPVEVRMKGGSLTIEWAAGEPIVMRGAATHVFSGEIDLDAFAT